MLTTDKNIFNNYTYLSSVWIYLHLLVWSLNIFSLVRYFKFIVQITKKIHLNKYNSHSMLKRYQIISLIDMCVVINGKSFLNDPTIVKKPL